MSDWQASLGRITLLPASPGFSTDISAHALFTQVWNSEPDNFQSQQNPLVPSIAQGRRGMLQVACSVQRSRVDFNITPYNQSSRQLVVPVIKSGSELGAEFRAIIASIERSPIAAPVTRVALFAQFICVVSSFGEANRKLVLALPQTLGLTEIHGEDFALQLNTPHASSSIPGVTVNVVSRWSASRLKMVNLIIRANAGTTGPQTQEKDFLTASVAFDLNSGLSSAPLSGSEQGSLLREQFADLSEHLALTHLDVEGFSNV